MTPVGILAVQGDFQAHGKALDRLGTAWRFVKKPSEINAKDPIMGSCELPCQQATSAAQIHD